MKPELRSKYSKIISNGEWVFKKNEALSISGPNRTEPLDLLMIPGWKSKSGTVRRKFLYHLIILKFNKTHLIFYFYMTSTLD